VKKNIEDYIFHIEKFMGSKYCDHSIDVLSKGSWIKHEWTSYGDLGPFEDLEKEAEMLDWEADCDIDISEEINNVDALIIENLKDALSDYLTSFKYNWFRGWQGYTGIKFNRYFPGQGMKEHWDNIHSIFDGEKKGIPILTCIGVLNDDYEGGDLMICQDKIETKKGDLLIFPSSFMYPHEVMPVTEGVRYSWISWAY